MCDREIKQTNSDFFYHKNDTIVEIRVQYIVVDQIISDSDMCDNCELPTAEKNFQTKLAGNRQQK